MYTTFIGEDHCLARALKNIIDFNSLVLHKYSQNILNYYFLEKSKKNRMLTQRMTISRKFCLFS